MSAEITYLKQLLDEEQWDKVLKYAEQLLFRGSSLGAVDLAWINYATAKAKNEKDEFFAAIPPGELARKLAKDAGLWDLHGRTMLTLAYSYYHTRQYEQSLNCAYEFLTSIGFYDNALDVEHGVWMLIGLSRLTLGDHRQAYQAFQRSAEAATRLGDSRRAFVAQHHALECLYHIDPGRIPELLFQCACHVRGHPEDTIVLTLYLQDRATYELHRKRYARAMALCRKALRIPHTTPYMISWAKYNCNMLLAATHRQMGNLQLALGHAMTARMAAIQGKLFHLEFEAASIIHELLTSVGQDTARELDQHYLQSGVDLTTLLGETAVKERSGFS